MVESHASASRFGVHMRVLVVEDEKRLAQNVAAGLRQCAGYAVDVAGDGEASLFIAEGNKYDPVVLDLMLPRLAGPVVLQRHRQTGTQNPAVVLAAPDDQKSIIQRVH